MIETIVILLLSVFFFITGKVRSDIVALCSLVALMVLGILEPAEALSGFSNNVIIMMVGLFVVGGGCGRPDTGCRCGHPGRKRPDHLR